MKAASPKFLLPTCNYPLNDYIFPVGGTIMKKLAFYAFLTILPGACTTDNMTYGDTLQPWIGQSEERLQQSWGLPRSEFYVTPDTKVVTYLEFSSRPIDGNTKPYAGYEVHYPAIATPDFGFPNQPQYSDYYCKTNFTITNGIVSNYSFNGDDCVVRQ